MTSRRTICALIMASPFAIASAPADEVLHSRIFGFDELKAQPHGRATTKPVLEGNTHDGQHVEVHETELAPGGAPHPPHRHAHEEMFLVRSGTVRVLINERSSDLGPGGVAFIGSGDYHGISNPGAEPANYFVIALGRG